MDVIYILDKRGRYAAECVVIKGVEMQGMDASLSFSCRKRKRKRNQVSRSNAINEEVWGEGEGGKGGGGSVLF